MKKNDEMIRKPAQIMGINVIGSSISVVLARVRGFISHNKHFYIVTPNPELILMAQKNSELKEALNSADLPVPDGVGVNLASKYFFGKGLNIIPGRKLFVKLIELANKKGWRVFFLGGMGDEAEKAAEKLRLNYKSIQIETYAGPKLDENAEPASEVDRKLEKDAIDKIEKVEPKLLFVAFGNPKQEIWVHKNLKRLNIGGSMCVGGTFRYIAGISRLPPRWMEKAGLEWLWRLITEPWRAGRILNAVIIFPLKVFWSKITH